ncbi:magnesium transporter [Goodfellowiella coeruleoviolacea]|uniref:Magnesium transporter n=1 Tax=Goodfellowiella coeruleoviolacea TaxID=334858 RepID=A0AAE3GDI0_9PSEU|nr:magnesium transporter [Goodfellowiella coeruleoviolacea]
MFVVEYAVCTGGELRREVGGLADALDRLRSLPDESSFVWIGLVEPSPSDMHELAEEVGLPPLAVAASLRPHQRTRYQLYDRILFVLLKTLQYDDPTSKVETGQLTLFLGERFLVTVRQGAGDPFPEVWANVSAHPGLLRHGAKSLAYAVGGAVADGYNEVSDELATDIAQLEERIFAPGRTNAVDAIYALKREVLEGREAVQPLEVEAREFLSGTLPLTAEAREPYFREVANRVLRAAATIRTSEELLNSILDAHLGQISTWQNEDMRKISAWAAIAAAPTTIAGIYGMNFDHMPELHWSIGYPLVLGVMAAICYGLFRAFRRNGWL